MSIIEKINQKVVDLAYKFPVIYLTVNIWMTYSLFSDFKYWVEKIISFAVCFCLIYTYLGLLDRKYFKCHINNLEDIQDSDIRWQCLPFFSMVTFIIINWVYHYLKM